MAVLKSNKLLLIDLHCFPCINYYKLLVVHNQLKFEQYEHFQKGSYSNRYYVAGANGRILLSIPLLHSGREKVAFKDLKISYTDRWQLIHWRTLTSAYRRSPWFEVYEDDIRLLYEEKFKYLKDWNLTAFELVNKWLQVSWEISWTEEYFKSYADPEVEDARNRISPKNAMETFKDDFTRYRQVFEDHTGFLPGLSILDLIFCEGRNAGSIIRG